MLRYQTLDCHLSEGFPGCCLCLMTPNKLYLLTRGLQTHAWNPHPSEECPKAIPALSALRLLISSSGIPPSVKSCLLSTPVPSLIGGVFPEPLTFHLWPSRCNTSRALPAASYPVLLSEACALCLWLLPDRCSDLKATQSTNHVIPFSAPRAYPLATTSLSHWEAGPTGF